MVIVLETRFSSEELWYRMVTVAAAALTVAAAPVPVAFPPASITLAAAVLAAIDAATLDPARMQLRRGRQSRRIVFAHRVL